jgi:hypothetical protein
MVECTFSSEHDYEKDRDHQTKSRGSKIACHQSAAETPKTLTSSPHIRGPEHILIVRTC